MPQPQQPGQGIAPNMMKSLVPILLGAGLDSFANSIKKLAATFGVDASQKKGSEQPAGPQGAPQAAQMAGQGGVAAPNPNSGFQQMIPLLAQLIASRQG